MKGQTLCVYGIVTKLQVVHGARYRFGPDPKGFYMFEPYWFTFFGTTYANGRCLKIIEVVNVSAEGIPYFDLHKALNRSGSVSFLDPVECR